MRFRNPSILACNEAINMRGLEMRKTRGLLAILSFLILAGCAPAIIGAGVAGGYKVGSDERSVGQMWDDSAITARVNAALIDDRNVKARKIDVDTLQQVVILTGVVESEEVAKEAEKIARSIPYVKTVRNHLQIGKKSIGESLDDKLIGSKIKARLITEKNIRSLNIDVDVNRGVVTLTGAVENPGQKGRALKIARSTSGVSEVIDNLIVREK
jgi:hyperosmotically inducible protein